MSLFGFEKSTSIFRLSKRPTLKVRTEMRGNETWMITYIVCDYCGFESKECTYNQEDKKWKCNVCKH